MRCPRCSGDLNLDDVLDFGFCRHCGSHVSMEEILDFCDDEEMDGLVDKYKDEMFSLFESGRIAEAQSLAKRIIRLDGSDADAWYMDGVCTLDLSDYPHETDSMKDAMDSFGRFEELTGLDVDIDSEAFKRYLEGAKKGDVQAQRRVGIMYSRGMGTLQSPDKAMEWFQKAYIRGCKEVRADISDALMIMDSKHYIVPSFVDEIWDGMFEGSRFSSVAIPGSVTRIGDRAFAGCDNLESVDLPGNLKSIGKEAFYRCESLRSITIPESVTSVGPHAFYNHGMEKATVLSKIISERRSYYMGPGEEIFSERTKVDWNLPESDGKGSPTVAPSTPAPESEDPPILETVDRIWIRAGMALTILFPLIVLGIIWSEFYEIPYVAMVLSIAPALTIPLRFNSDILLIACAIDVILVVFGIIAGFFNDLFFTLAEVVIVDIVAMAIMFVLAAMYPGRVKS